MPLPPPHPCSAEANLQAALALLLELQRQGLRRLVLCPGSRSAPLALAAGLLAEQGLELFCGVDERSAAFLALGLSRGDGRPAALVTTSGTAVANLLPAVVEADFGAIPLLVLSADRPARLKGCGANQTVNQESFLASSCRCLLHGDPRGLAAMECSDLRVFAQQAWAKALLPPWGPVHCNLPFEEPLHAPAESISRLQSELKAQSPEAASGEDLIPFPAAGTGEGLPFDLDRPGVVIAGPWRGRAEDLPGFAAALQRWQARTGWPVLADPLSGLRGWPGLSCVLSYDLFLADGHQLPSAPQLLRLGPVPASRRLQAWIQRSAGAQFLISEQDPRNLDALGTATQHWPYGLEAWLAQHPASRWDAPVAAVNQRWRDLWWAAEQQVQQRLDQLLPAQGLSEPGLARSLSRALPADWGLMLASSSPVRDWESFSAPDAPCRSIDGFRGASGIDGTLSLAAGLAISRGPLVLLSGDLALLHDANGWLWLQQLRERGAQLTVVMVDNGGGGIFEQLPIRPALDFELLFAMPQALDHLRWADGYGIPAQRVESLEALPQAMAWAHGQTLSLLVVQTDRQVDAELRQSLRRTMVELATR